ncbi:hypothetical protein NSPZN2_30281 [Nitrospira defluvii]|uniref:Transposase n=1 Tax=Nitrospira defluvii TaxID=330214 RepID=A0ABM8RHF2_9BACT|nr:hypothetical protein NSPZN2_30281 [Nitrospira defluvii]
MLRYRILSQVSKLARGRLLGMVNAVCLNVEIPPFEMCVVYEERFQKSKAMGTKRI